MKPFTFYFFSCLLIIAFISCSKDIKTKTNNEKIVGVWFNDDTLYEYNRISRMQYDFKEDNTVEELRIEIDKNTGDVLGYRYRAIGNYSLEDNHLSFFNMKSYANDDTKGSYTAIGNLVLLKGISWNYTVNCEFEDNDRKLTLIYAPCGELANCVGSATFFKEY